ncbi:hypothetical protein NOVOSPHI9U_420246 [Novosphingobium sp. 9U]|nr:hypothetical protein NOVOSPHI9U_420246 [Novosphingobium sp. 9U]
MPTTRLRQSAVSSSYRGLALSFGDKLSPEACGLFVNRSGPALPAADLAPSPAMLSFSEHAS